MKYEIKAVYRGRGFSLKYYMTYNETWTYEEVLEKLNKRLAGQVPVTKWVWGCLLVNGKQVVHKAIMGRGYVG